MRIAILQTDPNDTHAISSLLEGVGLACHGFRDLSRLILGLRTDAYDLAIVDTSSHPPHEIPARLRGTTGFPAPILFITGSDVGEDLLERFIDGVNDCVARPLRGTELLARVQSLLLRTYPASMNQELRFGAYAFDPDQSQVLFVAQEPLHTATLTYKEFQLALLMFRNINRSLSRNYIRDAVWGRDVALSSRTMDTHVSRIRQKLRLDDSSRFRMMPVYGFGYRLDDTGAA